MNKLLSIASLLIFLSMTFTLPSYAGSHEKAEGTSESADEAKKAMESSEGTDEKADKKDDNDKKAAGDEEPECD